MTNQNLGIGQVLFAPIAQTLHKWGMPLPAICNYLLEENPPIKEEGVKAVKNEILPPGVERDAEGKLVYNREKGLREIARRFNEHLNNPYSLGKQRDRYDAARRR